jgi:hypothetical protein
VPFMTRLPADLIREGLTVETVPGWQTRGSSSFAPAGVVCHWTAGPRGTLARPSLNVVTNGRAGLPGPLCNVYLARNGTAVVVAAGRANHAGLGGYLGLVGNSAVYGIEAESAGDGDWTDAQRQAYPRVVAAMLRGLGRDSRWALGHNEWAPTRKIDIRDWPMSGMRKQVDAILSQAAGVSNLVSGAPDGGSILLPDGSLPDSLKPKGFLMALSDTKQDEVYDAIKRLDERFGPIGELNGKFDFIKQGIVDIRGGMEGLPALFMAIAGLIKDSEVDVDEVALADALAPVLRVVSDDEISRIARAVSDEDDRREQVRLSTPVA